MATHDVRTEIIKFPGAEALTFRIQVGVVWLRSCYASIYWIPLLCGGQAQHADVCRMQYSMHLQRLPHWWVKMNTYLLFIERIQCAARKIFQVKPQRWSSKSANSKTMREKSRDLTLISVMGGQQTVMTIFFTVSHRFMRWERMAVFDMCGRSSFCYILLGISKKWVIHFQFSLQHTRRRPRTISAPRITNMVKYVCKQLYYYIITRTDVIYVHVAIVALSLL